MIHFRHKLNTVATTLSTIVLLAYSALAGTVSGHVRDQNGVGLKDVDLDFFDSANGAKLVTPGDTTGVGGSFSLTVPNGSYRVSFDPSLITGQKLAPKQIFNIIINGVTDLGNVILLPGIAVSGKVTGPGGTAVANADLDLIDSNTGIKAFTPNDNTDGAGNFSFVAEKGSYVVQVQPQKSSKLVAKKFGPFNMQTDSALGTFGVGLGALLSGNVSSAGGQSIVGVNLDVKDLSTGFAIPLLDDVTDLSGHYQVVVPLSNIQVTFNPPLGSVYGVLVMGNIAIAGDQTLDVNLQIGGGSDPTPTLLNLGDTMLGSFSSALEVDEIQFSALEGQFLSIDARKTSGDAIPTFELISPDDTPLSVSGFAKTSTLGAKVTKIPLPETGQFRLLSFPRSGTAGNYKIKISATTPVSLKTIPLTGTVANAGEIVEFTFSALPGSILKGSLAPAKGSAILPEIAGLIAPDLSSVAVVDVVTLPNNKLRIAGTGTTLMQLGVYRFKVTGAPGTTGIFSGSLKITFPKFKAATVLEN